jgi:hypothetical protein
MTVTKTKKPKIKKRTPGLVINPPPPRPVEEDNPSAQLFRAAKEAEIQALTAPSDPPQPYPTQPSPTQPNPPQTTVSQIIAPERDFNRRANSLERDALPSGLFPGTSKKLYDALYLRTRGAVVPVRTIQATRRELMSWSGIRSKNTIAINLQILTSVGLVVRNLELGDHGGSLYEINLPEELGYPNPPQPSPTLPNPTQPNPTQKLGRDPTQVLGRVGEGNLVDSISTYAFPKTSFKTDEKNDDDDDAFASLCGLLRETTREVTGKNPSPSERQRWRELGEVLTTELKIAAARTTVSSVPSFLTEHLRRRLWKVDRKQGREASSAEELKPASGEQARNCPDCGGTGFYYPEGYEGGVAKCRHARLSEGAP